MALRIVGCPQALAGDGDGGVKPGGGAYRPQEEGGRGRWEPGVLPLWAVSSLAFSSPVPSDSSGVRAPSSLLCLPISRVGKYRLRGEGSPLQPGAPRGWGCSHLPRQNVSLVLPHRRRQLLPSPVRHWSCLCWMLLQPDPYGGRHRAVWGPGWQGAVDRVSQIWVSVPALLLTSTLTPS